jgi:predicted metalloprotease
LLAIRVRSLLAISIAFRRSPTTFVDVVRRTSSHRVRRTSRVLAVVVAVATFVCTSVVSSAFTPASAAAAKTVRTPFPALTSPYGDTLRTIAADIDLFWVESLPKIGKKAYKPLVGYYAATSINSRLPRCGPRSPEYEDVAGNAFYCRSGNFIAFDNEVLFPEIYNKYGVIGLAMVLAHEVGHGIQSQLGSRLPSIFAELQADCFAGSWLRRVTNDASPILNIEGKAVLDDAVLAVLDFRDSPGIGAGTPGAHGNGFDRVNSFQLGFEEGVSRCASFGTLRPLVTASSFQPGDSGDVPIDGAISIGVNTNNAFYKQAIPGFTGVEVSRLVPATESAIDEAARACTRGQLLVDAIFSWCPVDTDGKPTLMYDSRRFDRIYQATGDFGVSFAIALAFAGFVQQLTGQPISNSSSQAALQANCYAGSWIAFADAPTAENPLSPGDLDEALQVLIGVPDTTPAFDRVARVRNGFVRGIGSCVA